MTTHKMFEGAEAIQIVTTTKAKAEKFARRFRRNKHISSVRIYPYKGKKGDLLARANRGVVIPARFKYRVVLRKRGDWWSDELPLRAGIRMAFSF